MRALSVLVSSAVIIALALCFATCSGSDAKSLTDEGFNALGHGDYKGALSSFDAALAKIGTNANDPSYVRAKLYRCQALGRIDANRARTDFLALAAEQPAQIHENDYGLIVDSMVKARTVEASEAALDVVDAAKKSFPGSTKIDAMVNTVGEASTKLNNPKLKNRLKGLGYVGD